MRLCREQAAREGWSVAGSYEDAAILVPRSQVMTRLVLDRQAFLSPLFDLLVAGFASHTFAVMPAEALRRIAMRSVGQARLNMTNLAHRGGEGSEFSSVMNLAWLWPAYPAPAYPAWLTG